MPSPRGAPQAGEQLSLFLPLSLCFSLVLLQRNLAGRLKTKCPHQSAQR